MAFQVPALCGDQTLTLNFFFISKSKGNMFGQSIIVDLEIKGGIVSANDYSHRLPEEEKQPEIVGSIR